MLVCAYAIKFPFFFLLHAAANRIVHLFGTDYIYIYKKNGNVLKLPEYPGLNF